MVQTNFSNVDSKSQRCVWEHWQLKRSCQSTIVASFFLCLLGFVWYSFKDLVCDEYYMRLKHLSSDIISVSCFFAMLFVRLNVILLLWKPFGWLYVN